MTWLSFFDLEIFATSNADFKPGRCSHSISIEMVIVIVVIISFGDSALLCRLGWPRSHDCPVLAILCWDNSHHHHDQFLISVRHG